MNKPSESAEFAKIKESVHQSWAKWEAKEGVTLSVDAFSFPMMFNSGLDEKQS